jgi:hypothetical protein
VKVGVEMMMSRISWSAQALDSIPSSSQRFFNLAYVFSTNFPCTSCCLLSLMYSTELLSLFNLAVFITTGKMSYAFMTSRSKCGTFLRITIARIG